ncbi:MAG: hypothetical protein EA351_00260 [Gemmatimonadales bacterium]|nr:MAG: hypothetical protein EA351_00260 [Gemmatimonadales bacterium]
MTAVAVPLMLFGPVDLAAQVPCGVSDISTGHQELSSVVTAFYVFSDCEGVRQVELVVAWRGSRPGWFRNVLTDRDELKRYQPGGDIFELSEEWKAHVVNSIRPDYGVSQASAYGEFLWGAVHYPEVGRWYLVHGFDPPSFDVLGHFDVEMGDGSMLVVFVDDADGDAKVADARAQPARDAASLAPTRDELRIARERSAVPAGYDPKGLLREIVTSSAVGAGFLSGSSIPDPPR